MSKDPRDLFSRRWAKAGKYLKLKNNKISILTILIFIAGCFFCIQVNNSGVQNRALKDTDNFLPEKYSARFFCEKIKEQNKLISSFSKQNMDGDFCLIPPDKSPEVVEMEKKLYAMVQDYPIKEMVPYIAKYDRETAALIIGIAKKESDWGKHSPSKNGQTCYNYWGYKGAGSRGLAMGYGCFASPREGVEVAGGRVEELVNKNLNTPSKMVVWKCGSDCNATGGQAAARKWISDVNIYFNRIAVL